MKFDISAFGVLTRYHGDSTHVSVPEGVRSIEHDAFRGCPSLTELRLPHSIEAFDAHATVGCPQLRFHEQDGVRYLGAEDTPYLVLVEAQKDTVAHDVKDGCRLIASHAFDACERLSRITLPSSVAFIGDMAFYGCTALGDITLPAGLQAIGDCAFEDCALTRITLPDGLLRVGRCAFSCVTLKEVTLADSLTRIGRDAFTRNPLCFTEDEEGYYLGSAACPYLCFMRPADRCARTLRVHEGCCFIYTGACMRTAVEEVVLPDGLLHIGQDAFRECPSLRRARLPQSVGYIDACAFASCAALGEVTLPCGALTVGEGAFMGCSALEEITLPCAAVEDYAFSDCTSLRAVQLGEGSRLCGEYIFSDCTALRTLTLPQALKGRSDETLLEGCSDVQVRYG